ESFATTRSTSGTVVLRSSICSGSHFGINTLFRSWGWALADRAAARVTAPGVPARKMRRFISSLRMLGSSLRVLSARSGPLRAAGRDWGNWLNFGCELFPEYSRSRQCVDSSRPRGPDFPLGFRTGRPAPAPAGFGQETHGLLVADQLSVKQMVGRVHE